MGYPAAITYTTLLGMYVDVHDYLRAIGMLPPGPVPEHADERIYELIVDELRLGPSLVVSLPLDVRAEALADAVDPTHANARDFLADGYQLPGLAYKAMHHDLNMRLHTGARLMVVGVLLHQATGEDDNPMLVGLDLDNINGQPLSAYRERLDQLMMELAERNPQLYELFRGQAVKMYQVGDDCACCT